MSERLSAGSICWAADPTGVHPERPVVILSHETHPYGATECAVMCLGTSVSQFQQPTPPLEEHHYDGISFNRTPHLLPWALRTIAPGSLETGRAVGQLTGDGQRTVKKALLLLFAV
jgi:hypothetical protein